MKEKHTTQVDNWPKIGYGARFMPWGRGASMVMDMQMKEGSWEAFMADRLAEVLDDEIKKALQ
eukprot:4064021-Prorocentrum_lima.AAC.1